MTRKFYGSVIGQPPQHDSLAPSGVFSVGSLSEGTGYDVPSLDLSFDGQASSYRRTSTSPTAPKANGDELATGLITCVRNSTAFFVNGSGNLQEAAANTPRVEYDPSGNPLGLLVEEARTNYVLDSMDVSVGATNWAVTNGTSDVSGATLTAPDGVGTAQVMEGDSPNSYSQLPQTVSITADYIACSVYVSWPGTDPSDAIALRVQGTNHADDAGFTSFTETITQYKLTRSAATSFVRVNRGHALNPTVEDIGNGWYRVSMVVRTNGGTVSKVTVYPSFGAPGGRAAYWGAQAEVGEGPTSVIRTTSTTKTRSKDEITVATSSFGVNPAEETIAVDFEQASPPSATNPRIYELHSGSTTSRRMVLYVGRGTSDVRAQWIAGGNTTTQVVASAASYPVEYKIAQRRDGTSGNYAVDGSLGTSTTITQGSTAPTTLSLGCNSGGSGTMNGHIRRLRYFPRALSDYSLTQYTTGSGPEPNRLLRKWGGMIGSGVSDEPSAVLKLAEDYQSALIGLPQVAGAGFNLSTASGGGGYSGQSGSGSTFYTCASSSTRVNSSGALETVGLNAARTGHHVWNGSAWVNEGILLESEARTNLLLNSATLSTQNVTVSATAHTLSFTGTGTITLTGASTSGPLVGAGTGEQNRVSLTFTPTAGTLTLTVSGTVTNAQLEAGSTASSYIPTTSSTVTRAAQALSVPSSGLSWPTGSNAAISVHLAGRMTFADEDQSMQHVFWRWKKDNNNQIRVLYDTHSSHGTGRISFQQIESNTYDLVNSSANIFSPGDLVPFKIASRHGSTFTNAAVDGTVLTENTTPTALPDLSASSIEIGPDFMGTIKTFNVWYEDIGDAGLVEITT